MHAFIGRFPRPVAAQAAAAALVSAMVLAACGGGGGDSAPTATLSQTDAVLPKNTPIVVRFSESMNPASLKLGGSLAGEGTGAWSRTHADNDTYTLSPPGTGWTSGQGNLSIDASDTGGSALATLRATFMVRLAFDNFQPAEVVIGQADFSGNSVNQGGNSPAANTLGSSYGSVAVAPDGKLFIGDRFNNRVLAYNAVPKANNASGDFVLGQPDFTSNTRTVQRGSHPGPLQVSTANGRLVVTDFIGNRVVIYNSLPADGSAEPSVVVGQPDYTSFGTACTAAGMNGPTAATTTPNGKLIVADRFNHRVLIWNSMPAAVGQPADVVLGQPDLDQCVPSGPTDRTLNQPAGLWSDGTRLVVNDSNNSRVLIWNQIPTSHFQPADVVLGQASFELNTANDDDKNGSNDGRPTARTLARPFSGVASDGSQLAVADADNNRVLIWNSFPTNNFQPADVVLGQGAFDRALPNDADQDGSTDPTASARVFSDPSGLLFHQDKLFVTDGNNSRVLVFRSK